MSGWSLNLASTPNPKASRLVSDNKTMVSSNMHLRQHLLSVIILTIASGMLALSPVQADNNGVHWNNLDQGEQHILKRHTQRWPDYSLEKKRALKKSARQYYNMSPGQKDRVKKRARTFRQLSAQDRHEACQRYNRQHGRLPPVCLR